MDYDGFLPKFHLPEEKGYWSRLELDLKSTIEKKTIKGEKEIFLMEWKIRRELCELRQIQIWFNNIVHNYIQNIYSALCAPKKLVELYSL